MFLNIKWLHLFDGPAGRNVFQFQKYFFTFQTKKKPCLVRQNLLTSRFAFLEFNRLVKCQNNGPDHQDQTDKLQQVNEIRLHFGYIYLVCAGIPANGTKCRSGIKRGSRATMSDGLYPRQEISSGVSPTLHFSLNFSAPSTEERL